MQTAKKTAFYIEQSSLIVSAESGLMATHDHHRYFPIDGMICHAAPSDVEEIDIIKPFQFSENGLCTYYTLAQPAAEHADTNTGAAGNTPASDSNAGYDELDDSEDVRVFIAEMDNGINGCAIRFAAILAMAALLTYLIYKL